MVEASEEGASEEAEPGFVSLSGRGMTGPYDHAGSVELAALGKDRDQHAGHPFKEGGRRADSHARLAEIERAVPHGLVGLEVPGHDHLGLHVGAIRLTAISGPRRGGIPVILPKRGVIQHGLERSAKSGPE